MPITRRYGRLQFPHGAEIVPTTVDADGSLNVWNSPQAPILDHEAGVWRTGDPLDAALGFPSAGVNFVDTDAGGRYPWFAESLRQIKPGDILSS